MSSRKPNKITSMHRSPRGFTLIELLVVVAILGVIAVIVIPSVRTLNEDRKVRDTARVVGAVFAAARERAAVDGQAGVEIVTIANASGTYNMPNMGLILYQLRSIPPYIGDTLGAAATTTSGSGMYEARFTGADIIAAGIQAGDFLELNGSGIKLRILAVIDGPLPANDDYLLFQNPSPNPPLPGASVPFKIHRQPIRVQSSALRLPNNLFLNLAFSGHGFSPTTVGPAGNQLRGRQFRDFSTPLAGHPDPGGYPAPEGSTLIWFAADGSISYVTTRSYVESPPGLPPLVYDSSFMQKPTGPVYLLMCNGRGDEVDLTDLDSVNFLQDDNNLWITIDHRSGSVTMARTAQLDTVLNATNTLRTQIQDARLLARTRRTGNP